jgi:hypothetical protein
MKPSSSTTTSAHTVTDNAESYMFMSSDIAGKIDMTDDGTTLKDHIGLEIDTKIVNFPLVMLEIIDDGYRACLLDQDSIKRFTNRLLTGDFIVTYILDRKFNSQVIKLESDRCYLRVTR